MASILKVDKIVPVGSGGVSIAPASSTPTSPSAGDMHFDTTSNTLKIYNELSFHIIIMNSNHLINNYR